MIVAEVVRSGFVESVHHGIVALTVGKSFGDVDSPFFPRSSNKPLQTVGLLNAGLVPREEADLALMSGSHDGEPFHIERVRAMLAAAGLGPEALRCPADLPLGEAARNAWLRGGGEAEPILMNCSGKHAGMLATCVVNGWPLESYLEVGHPLQKALADAVSRLAGEPIAAFGVDGCGAPIFAISPMGLARAFQRLVEAEPGTPERRVADAMRAHPALVAGTGTEDTVLMTAIPGLLVKKGADGVAAAALPGLGAVALKISDGATRARVPVLLEALRRLGAETPEIPEVVLGGGRPVGEVRAVW
ncbi:putative L-asparaginase II [Actinoplanes missouriensis 431]|uniref:Putative L-asparaginase II n=1 Tax=Actinoplanes missouriensis (strain ATCC 14538 / DSM 43046 / CBS 188.64 / JCM 3121 / NBRC 102363 / NCIMB 12654 / NRRL B-3342 / UNCC 431) TaxID=512565 RepID=I0HIQ3_ACTM4|nr:asparaginase [Actinoplanes missouriensis]BAL92890.1 putative L-asparaginase II [Actinoplanes missouriensis 431]